MNNTLSFLTRVYQSTWLSASILFVYLTLTILMILANTSLGPQMFSIWPGLAGVLESFYLNAWVHMLLILASVNLLADAFKKHPRFRDRFKKIVKPFASLKMAVVVIVSLAVISSVGTFVEAQYNLEAAQKMVYHTPWMYGVLGMLSISLLAVMIDRLPWKMHHASFVLAHVGIILLLLGSLETKEKGVDGSMRFEIGQKNREITLPETEISVYSSFDGDRYTQVFQKEVDFFRRSPKGNPLEIPIQEGVIRVVDYSKYALGSKRIVESAQPRNGAGIRFSISMAGQEVTEWLVQRRPTGRASQEIGPAKVTLGAPPNEDVQANEVFIIPGTHDRVKYVVFYRDTSRKAKRGTLKPGETLETGWGAVKFKLLTYFPKAEEVWEFKDLERPTPLTNSVITLEVKGQNHRVQLNDMLKFFTDQAVYIVTFSNKRLDSGVDLTLLRFDIGRYQGTMRAMAYKSSVHVPGLGEHEISMNEPLKYNNFTFYQASFEEDEMGQPRASVLSVNRDPGRWEKYLGAFLIVLGSSLLFYRRKLKQVELDQAT